MRKANIARPARGYWLILTVTALSILLASLVWIIPRPVGAESYHLADTGSPILPLILAAAIILFISNIVLIVLARRKK